MSLSLKIRKLNREVSGTHKSLFELINAIPPPHKATDNQDTPNPIILTQKAYENLIKISTSLHDKDCSLQALYRQQSKTKSQTSSLIHLKAELLDIKKYIQINSLKLSKDMKKLSLILRDYKERCQDSFLQFLKDIDVELRKSLKPLVPNDILEEQIKYKPINDNLSFSATAKSASNFDGDQLSDRNKTDNTEENKSEVLSKHIQLLVNTLEEVAKRLIGMTQKTAKAYYEIINPIEAYTEPPSPLAAPYPDYFSFDVTNLSEENRESYVFDQNSKKNILLKFAENENLECLDPKKTRKIKEKIHRLLSEEVKETEILDLFKEEEISISKREKLVFDICNSGRNGDNMVTLTDLIDISNIGTHSIIDSVRNKSIFEVSGSNYSQLISQIQGKDLTDKLDETLADFKSLDSSIDEKMIRPYRGRIKSEKLIFPSNSSESYMKILPPVSIKAKGRELKTKKSMQNIRIRSVTPGKKNNDDRRNQIKRSKTPIVKKKK